jgi:L-fuculose-phosphate aldolase
MAGSHGLKKEMVRYSRLVYDKGWVANHDGNLTARLGPGRILATPTSFSKGDVAEADLIVVDDAGQKVSGRHRGFSELALHMAAYAERKDIKAVIHAHPPYSTAMAVAGQGIERPILAEAVVSLGPRVPLVPFAMPKTAAWSEQIAAHCVQYDALILQNHGVITFGDNLEQAFLRLELVEHLAKIMHHSMAFGGPRTLDDAHLAPLLASRQKAGLGPQARGVSSSPAAPATTVAPTLPPQRADALDADTLVAIIKEELSRLV